MSGVWGSGGVDRMGQASTLLLSLPQGVLQGSGWEQPLLALPGPQPGL